MTYMISICLVILFSVPVFSEEIKFDKQTWMSQISTGFSHPKQPMVWGKKPTKVDQKLLETFRPDIYVSPDGQIPIDFYVDYLPLTQLHTATQNIALDQEKLKYWAEKESENSYVDYQGPFEIRSASPTAYGRVYKTKLNNLPVTVLKYTFVFLNSGLPKEIPALLSVFSGLAGDVDRWHILDIHGAVYVVLHQETQQPIAVFLAQHNHHRTYIVSKDVKWPDNNRIKIGFAERSNEPYLLPEGNQVVRHRTVPFPSAKNIKFLILGDKKPFIYGYDHVYPIAKGAKRVAYKMTYLSQFDPLYTSKIPLGNKYPIFFFFSHFSRQGPPGIDFASMPGLSDLGKRIPFWYFREGDEKAAEVMGRSFKKNFQVDIPAVLNYNGTQFESQIVL